MAFAIVDGNFNDPAIWDTGIVPTGTENAYANNRTIQITGTVNVGTVRNDANPYYLANTATPAMTGPTNPLGSAIASATIVGSEPWRAFDRSSTSGWTVGSGLGGWIGFQFTTGRVIRQYSFRAFSNATRPFATFTFEGSMNGSTWFNLDSPSAQNIGQGAFYTSNLLTNTVAYTHYRITGNGTVGSSSTLGVAEVEMTESTSLVVGNINGGGTFNLTNGSTLNCSAPTGVVVGSATPPITFALPFGSSASVNATIPSVAAVGNYRAVLLNGLGTLNFTGDISCGPTTAPNGHYVIQINLAGRLNYNGVCTNGGSNGNQCNSIISLAAAYIQITTTGFSGGNFGANPNASVWLNAGGTLEIIGPITGGNSPAVVMIGGTTIVTGNISTTTASPAITNITTAANIEPGGAITTSGSANAISSVGYVKVIVPLVNVNNWQAVYAPRITIESTTTSITFQKIGGGNQIMYIGTANNTNLPAVGNVRLSTTYGASNEFTGTMVVQTPPYVSLGALVDDNKVGTFLMTPASFVAELGTSTLDIAKRLQNSATVITTGTQLASFNI